MSMNESPCIPPGAFAWTAKVTRCQVRPAAWVMATTEDPALYVLPIRCAMRSVQYPGRQDRRREKCIDNIPELADVALDALRNWIKYPFALFGHSMGAVVAFEVAQRLKSNSEWHPLWLFASGRRAPSRHRNGSVHLLDDVGLAAELRCARGTDPRLLADAELLASILPITRNDFKAIETYTYTSTTPLDCPITALVGNADPHTTIDEASAWSEHSSQNFDLQVFPGDHFYLEHCKPDFAAAIAVKLNGGSPINHDYSVR